MSIKDVILPDIGEGVTEGEMVKWLVQVGDAVEVDQPIAEVMTDKATVEVPSPFSGKVKELKAHEGDIIPIEAPMLALETNGAAMAVSSAPPPPPPKEETASTAAAVGAPPSASKPTVSNQGFKGPSRGVTEAFSSGRERPGGGDIYPPVMESRVLATPGTRRLAREMNVDINQIQGTGNVGRVTREDVLQVVQVGSPLIAPPSRPRQEPSGRSEERVPLRGIRRKIAEQMQATKRIVPHFTLMDEANVTELYHLRKQAKEAGLEYGVNVTFLPFIMKALIASLRQFPEVNASIDDQAQEIVYKNDYHLGFATDTPQGLLVPNIKDADRKTILDLSREIAELATQAREGRLSLEDMKGASVTITNIGSIGGTYATPIINHPEVAILGVYKMVDKPVFQDGEFHPAKVMNFTVTCDHRLIDGAVAARFLASFIKRIESPSHLMLEMM